MGRLFPTRLKGSPLAQGNMTDNGKNLLGAAIIFFAALTAIFFSSFVLSGALDAYDEGMHFLNYSMFSAGKLPYLDYYPMFPPIWVYLQIIIEAIFGATVLVQRLWFVVQAALVVAVSYSALARFVRSRLISIAIPAFITILCMDAYWVARWSGARLVPYLVFFLILRRIYGRDDGARVWVFIAGLVAGASNLYALDTGIHLTLAGASILIITALTTPLGVLKKGVGSLAAALCGFVLPIALWAAYLAYNGAFLEYIKVYYLIYIIKMMPISARALSGGSFSMLVPRFALLVLFLASLFLWSMYLIIYKGFYRKALKGADQLVIAAIVLSVLASASTLRAVMGSQYTMFAFIPMLLWFGFFLDRGLSSSGRSARALPAVAVLLAAAVLSGALLKGDLKSRYGAVSASFSGAASYSGASRSSLPALRGLIEPDYFDAYARYLNANTTAGEPVWAFPMHVEIMPTLAGRHNASRFPIPVILMGSPEYQRILIASVEKERPRYLIFNPSAQLGTFRLDRYFGPVYDYIYANYTPDTGFPAGEFNPVWIRKIR